mmetsp:Transcript_70548/g.223528  ORF Transcript_70548/g.223528 Transcript_70548/m.223528 type:complete len:353 (-) Transcript_70548:1327-2385(-)
MSSAKRSSVQHTATTALSAGGWRAAAWSAVKPPQLQPIMPTAPVHHSWLAAHSMHSTASACPRSEYSSSRMPSESPQPRASTRRQARPCPARYGKVMLSISTVPSLLRYGSTSSTAGALGVAPPCRTTGRQRRAERRTPSFMGMSTLSTSKVMGRSRSLTTRTAPSSSSSCAASAPLLPLRESAAISLSTSAASSRSWEASVRRKSESLTPNRALICCTSCMAMRECPPISKKSSLAPTSGTLSRSLQHSASASSVAPEGGSYSSMRRAAVRSEGAGGGSALRSTLPLAVMGRRSMATNTLGTMYSGTLTRRASCRAAMSLAEREALPRSLLALESAALTSSCRASCPHLEV